MSADAYNLLACADCAFWSAKRRCHRYPPQRGFWVMIVNGFGITDFAFPETRALDWCGEHQPITEQVAG